MKNKKDINKEVEVVEEDVEEVVEEELEEIDESEEEAEEVEDELEEENKTTKDSVPLNKFLELKRQLKENKALINKLKEKELDSNLIKKRNSIIEKWTSKGYDNDFAEAIADEIVSISKEQYSNTKNSDFETQIDEDINDLSTSDSFFSDAKSYKSDIKKYIKKMKSKEIDITLEEAYMHVRGVGGRLKELRTDMEQRTLYNRKKKKDKSVDNSKSSSPKSESSLDKYDKEALKGLQIAQPNANWNEEKYTKLMKTKK